MGILAWGHLMFYTKSAAPSTKLPSFKELLTSMPARNNGQPRVNTPPIPSPSNTPPYSHNPHHYMHGTPQLYAPSGMHTPQPHHQHPHNQNQSHRGYQSSEPVSARTSPKAATEDSKKTHACKVCSRSFTTSGHLARHNRIHTGERKHECPWPTCTARFARQDNCMQHYKTHTSRTKRSKN